MSAVHLRRWTREEYDRMVELGILGEDDRVELIAGEIVQMPAQHGPHATSVGLVDDVLLRRNIAPLRRSNFRYGRGTA